MDWIAIGEPPVPALTYYQQRVLELLNAGKSALEIAVRLRSGMIWVREAIFEIRKRESIIMGKLTDEQRQEIYQSWKDGVSQHDLAKQYHVTRSAISQMICKMSKAAGEIGIQEQPKKPAVINEEFEQAVNEMVAEREAANAEKNAEITEPEKIPPVVRRAVTGHLNDLEMEIEDREQRIAELKIEIEEFKKDIVALKAWKEAHT